MLGFLVTLKNSVEKKQAASIEKVDLAKIVTSQSYEMRNHPFPHMVIDDFFQPDIYAQASAFFKECLARGLSETLGKSQFHPFVELHRKGREYDGYMYSPKYTEHPVLEIFTSVSLNLFFSSIMRVPTNTATSLAFHHHPPGDRTGYVHTDYTMKWFSEQDRLPNGAIYISRSDGEGKPGCFRCVRSIAVIYYLGESEWDPANNGGTGLYEPNCIVPSAIVEPRKNRVLAFPITPLAFHAFQANFAERNSIVQWFHTDMPHGVGSP